MAVRGKNCCVSAVLTDKFKAAVFFFKTELTFFGGGDCSFDATPSRDDVSHGKLGAGGRKPFSRGSLIFILRQISISQAASWLDSHRIWTAKFNSIS